MRQNVAPHFVMSERQLLEVSQITGSALSIYTAKFGIPIALETLEASEGADSPPRISWHSPIF